MSYPLITLYTPGINLDLARKADKYNADAIIIDLEDTVPPDKKKEVARFLLKSIVVYLKLASGPPKKGIR